MKLQTIKEAKIHIVETCTHAQHNNLHLNLPLARKTEKMRCKFCKKNRKLKTQKFPDNIKKCLMIFDNF